MTLVSSMAKEHRRLMDVEPLFLVNFGILEDLVILNDRFSVTDKTKIISKNILGK